MVFPEKLAFVVVMGLGLCCGLKVGKVLPGTMSVGAFQRWSRRRAARSRAAAWAPSALAGGSLRQEAPPSPLVT